MLQTFDSCQCKRNTYAHTCTHKKQTHSRMIWNELKNVVFDDQSQWWSSYAKLSRNEIPCIISEHTSMLEWWNSRAHKKRDQNRNGFRPEYHSSYVYNKSISSAKINTQGSQIGRAEQRDQNPFLRFSLYHTSFPYFGWSCCLCRGRRHCCCYCQHGRRRSIEKRVYEQRINVMNNNNIAWYWLYLISSHGYISHILWMFG